MVERGNCMVTAELKKLLEREAFFLFVKRSNKLQILKWTGIKTAAL
jgi:hypothetical protein